MDNDFADIQLNDQQRLLLASAADRLGISWPEVFYNRFGEHAPDLADAALVYLAERDQISKVFTLDFRDFAIYRTSDNRALEIVGVQSQ